MEDPVTNVPRPLTLTILCGFLAIASAMLTGCGSTMLMEEDAVRRITAPPDTEPHIVRCTGDFTTMPDGSIQEKRYVVVRVGRDAAGFPRQLSVDDDANDRVLNVEGRILHADGSSTRIPPSAFYRVNTSDEQTIAEEYARVAPLKEKVAQGDLVETVALIEHAFPRMGVRFSPAMFGYPADNVSCSVTTIPGQDLAMKVVNASVTPVTSTTPAGTVHTFTWPPYRPPGRTYHAMLERNPFSVLFLFPAGQSWTSFGDWYLDLVKDRLVPGKALADTTARVIAGKATPRERMDAIFAYCQRTIRYEQMFMEHGEFIPNAADVIFARKFGDCKDYATLMHAMAASAGIPTHLVICHRGRGYRMHEAEPVSQFNHVLLHYDDNGQDRWYDATDRLGLFGIPSFDLANATGLVVDRGRSRLVTITESPANLLRIEGNLMVSGESGLNGNVTVTFAQQYAVEHSWASDHMNPEKMRRLLTGTMHAVLNVDMIIDSLGWSCVRDSFAVTVRCRIPNCVATVGENRYVAAARLFPNLLPDDVEEDGVQKAFYFPYYNRVAMDVAVASAAGTRAPVHMRLAYQLPAGPFTDTDRPAFLAQLKEAINGFTHSIALPGTTHP
jgi:hypothetical protein